MLSKQVHRQLMKDRLFQLDDRSHIKMSLALSANLFWFLTQLPVIQKNWYIGAFAPIALEPVWNLAFDQRFDKCLSFPAFVPKEQKMIFKASMIEALELKEDFGVKIYGPKSKALEVKPEVLLIPGLAFNLKGQRLGRGKGFYDRYLENFSGLKVGMAFSLQISSELPVEKHDCEMDYLITEKEIIKIL